MKFCLDNLICYKVNCDQITQMQHFKVQLNWIESLLCVINMSMHSTGLLLIALGLASYLKWWVACGYLWGTGWRFDTPGLGDEHPKLVQNPGPLAPHHILSHFWKNSRYLILPFIIRTVTWQQKWRSVHAPVPGPLDKTLVTKQKKRRVAECTFYASLQECAALYSHQWINNRSLWILQLPQLSPVSFSKCSCLPHHAIPQQVDFFHCETLKNNLLMFYGKMGYKQKSFYHANIEHTLVHRVGDNTKATVQSPTLWSWQSISMFLTSTIPQNVFEILEGLMLQNSLTEITPLALNILRLPCLANLWYMQQNTHSRVGSFYFSGLIFRLKLSKHIKLILNNWPGSWYKYVKVCSWHPERLGICHYRAILNPRVKVYCQASNLAFRGLLKYKKCSFPLVNGLL